MWSHEVSQLTGQYTQQALQQNMYANSIGMMNPGMHADIATGNIANYAQAMGSPMLGAGAAMLGLDPFSMGLKGAGLGMSMGMGFGGMAGMAAGFAAPAIIGGAALNWTGGQMWAGAQQQQQLNMGLRQNFGFARPGGGQGFNSAEMGMIGNQIRGMTHEVGAGGEMHGFRELSALAGNMGRMGFSQNITDVRQFTTKFKEMVSTLKTVATELNTSLESAQQMVVGMRSSGIFSKSDQLRASSMMRQNALNGIDLETSSAMGNIGSQIARSIGGRGVSGAIGGMRTIGDIGTAMRSGALSEEDIYNATGLTGMAGQQAFATAQMQSSAQFLKSGRGRFMLASLADKNGNLDQSSLNEFMSGNMSVGRTGQMAGQGLNRVGAESFLRNEGRLRSSLLEAVGGNVNTLSLMQWAQHSGIDVGAMGDREMIFAGRQLHMGRDELDAAVKMANALPDIMKEQRQTATSDHANRGQLAIRQNSGLNGVKNSYNHFKEKLSGGVQHIGQNMYNEATNYVERYINEMSQTIVSDLTAQAEKDIRSYVTSGSSSTAGRRGAAISSLSKMAGAPKMTSSSFDVYRSRVQEDNVFGSVKQMFGGKTMEQSLGLGFTIDNNSKLSGREQFDFFREGLGAYDKGARSKEIDKTLEGMLPGTSSDVLKGKTGDDYMQTLNKLVQTHGTDEMKAKWDSAYGRANIGGKVGSNGSQNPMEDGWTYGKGERLEGREQLGRMAAGLGVASVNSYRSVDMEALLTGGFSGTEKDRLDAVGSLAMAGTINAKRGAAEAARNSWGRGAASIAGGVIGGAAAAFPTMGLGAVAGAPLGYAAGGKAYDAVRGLLGHETDKRAINYGYDHDISEIAKHNAMFIKDNMREGAAALAGGEDEGSVLKSMENRISKLQNSEHRNAAEESEYRSLNTLMAASSVRKAGGWDKMNDKQRKDLMDRYGRDGMTQDEMQQNIMGIATAFKQQASSQDKEMVGKYNREATTRLGAMYDAKTNSLITADAEWEKNNPEAAKILYNQRDMQEKLSKAGSIGEAEAIHKQYRDARDSRIYSTSADDRAKQRRALASGGVEGAQDEIDAIDDVNRSERRFRSTAGYGKAQAAKLADSGLSRQSLQKISLARNDEEMLSTMLSEGGLNGLSNEGKSAFRRAAKQLKSSDVKERDEGLRTLQGLKSSDTGVKEADMARRKEQAKRDPAQNAMLEMAESMKSLVQHFTANKGAQHVVVDNTVSMVEQQGGGITPGAGGDSGKPK